MWWVNIKIIKDIAFTFAFLQVCTNHYLQVLLKGKSIRIFDMPIRQSIQTFVFCYEMLPKRTKWLSNRINWFMLFCRNVDDHPVDLFILSSVKFFTIKTKLEEIALLASKDLTTAKGITSSGAWPDVSDYYWFKSPMPTPMRVFPYIQFIVIWLLLFKEFIVIFWIKCIHNDFTFKIFIFASNANKNM